MRKITATTSVVLISALLLAGCATEQESSTAVDETVTTNVESEATDSDSTTDATAKADSDQLSLADIDNTAPESVIAGSDAEIVWEALMGPDGEYAALASYQAVLDEYGDVEPYLTIMNAEAKHADALIRQLERLDVEVPENPYLGLIPAPENLTAAAEAWAEGEILNVEMYDQLLAQTSDSQITRVLTNLRRASLESHLPAFELAAENGGTLTAEQMPGH